MPKRSRSCIFYPRLNQKEDPDGAPSHISVSYEALEVLFHLPLKNAAKEVGLCPTTFKKACRRFGLEEWPFKKGQIRVPPVAPTEGVVSAAIPTKSRKPPNAAAAAAAAAAVRSQAGPPLPPRMQEGGHDNAAFTFSCSSPVWRDPLLSSSSAKARRAPPFSIPGQQITLPVILNPQPSNLSHQPSTLNPQPSTLNPQPPTLNPQPSTLNHRPQLNARPNLALAMPPGMLPPNNLAGQHTHPFAALAAQSAIHQVLAP